MRRLALVAIAQNLTACATSPTSQQLTLEMQSGPPLAELCFEATTAAAGGCSVGTMQDKRSGFETRPRPMTCNTSTYGKNTVTKRGED